ncbi:hypothetical protein MMC30_002762 [Trapelia coarctata]|nr:hypothetical protein [Trapelia coarctata]
MGSSELYRLWQQQDQDFRGKEPPCLKCTQTRSPSKVTFTVVVLILLASLSCNALLAYEEFQLLLEDSDESPTRYAGLLRDIAIPFTADTVYSSSNRTIADAAWNSADLDTDTGLIALEYAWASSRGLPKSQRFPWDESKGLYVLNGFYNMHCLHLLRRSILEVHDGVTQTIPLSDLMHCLDLFREDIMCNADDTPRYTGRVNQQAGAEQPISGIGQTRMCKDWGKLRVWANEQSACYKGINLDDPGFLSVERFKFCSGGERIWSP